MLNKSIPLYYILIASIGVAVATSFAWFYFSKPTTSITKEGNVKSCNEYKIARLGGYDYVRPLVYAEHNCESNRYTSTKLTLNEIINNYKKAGTLTSASIYLRDFTQGEWMLIGADETFTPGSLIKVPILITYMRMVEKDPSLLQKRLILAKNSPNVPPQTYNKKGIHLDTEYTVAELLKYMIADSDNYATLLLNQHIDVAALKKVFTDLGLENPNVNDRNFQITSQDYSVFMKALYNASYLTINDSEYATELLSDCSFKEGFIKLLPDSVKVAHKFGEAGTAIEHQLHESGIVYVKDNPYLLTIMTKGPDVKKLPEVISKISKTVFDDMTKHP